MSELGKLAPPYPRDDCTNVDCERKLDEVEGVYLYKDLEDGKLVILCDDCARHAELVAPERFLLVPL